MDEHLKLLEEDDAASRPYRARRLAVLLEEFGEPRGMLFHGGLLSFNAFEEARRAYLNGLDVATVVLAQMTVEHLLAGLLRGAGRDGSWSFGEILRLARDEGFISTSEFDLFDGIRATRNPYAHARTPMSPGTLAARLTDSVGPYDLMEGDATLAITALLRLMHRHPFALQDLESPSDRG